MGSGLLGSVQDALAAATTLAGILVAVVVSVVVVVEVEVVVDQSVIRGPGIWQDAGQASKRKLGQPATTCTWMTTLLTHSLHSVSRGSGWLSSKYNRNSLSLHQ